jgi:hypothetical protein
MIVRMSGSAAELGELPPEPWGRRLRRAREDVGGYTNVDRAAEKVSRYQLTTGSTLARLEKLDEPPTNRQRRVLATIALIIYGIDPEPFGLGRDDLPPAIYAQLRKSRPKFEWITADELRPTRAAAA